MSEKDIAGFLLFLSRYFLCNSCNLPRSIRFQIILKYFSRQNLNIFGNEIKWLEKMSPPAPTRTPNLSWTPIEPKRVILVPKGSKLAISLHANQNQSESFLPELFLRNNISEESTLTTRIQRIKIYYIQNLKWKCVLYLHNNTFEYI